MKLSIITVNLNNRDGLQKTIDSVVAQTFKEFEWIVIDGGSSDGSKELIEQFADHIAYWVSEPDKGIYNAMNKGIKVAKGEYLLFLNSGDFFYERMSLEKVVKAGLDADVVYGYLLVDKGVEREVHKYSEDITLGTFIYETINHSGCAFIRKSLFEKYGLYDESLRIVSDWKFFLQAIGMGDASVKYVDVLVSVFVADGISNTNAELCEKERYAVLNTCIPQRILKDYKKMEDERNSFLQYEQQIRSSASYKIGKALLRPFKWIRKVLFHGWEVCKLKAIRLFSFCKKLRLGFTSNYNRKNYKEIPIIICNFNRLEYLRETLKSLMNKGYNNLYVLDNKSTYQPLLEFYEKDCPCPVLRLNENYGHKALWDSGAVKDFDKDFFVYTDPDLVFKDDCPEDIVLFMLNVLKRHPRVDKIAASLEISDIPEEYPLKEKVLQNEQRFFEKMKYGCYVADVDTTFAMYYPFSSAAFHEEDFTLRTPRPYMMKHLPWYRVGESEEDRYYVEHKRKDVGWWVN